MIPIDDRIPAETCHVGEYLDDEIEFRGWSVRDCAMRMPGDFAVNELALNLTIACSQADDPMKYIDVSIGEETARGLEIATGVSAQTWLNLESQWQRWVRAKAKGKQ